MLPPRYPAKVTSHDPHKGGPRYVRCAPRSLPPATLLTLCEHLDGPPAEVVAAARAALDRARAMAGRDGAVVVAGSIYLIAELVREEGALRASAL